jgi:hypothetical protein
LNSRCLVQSLGRDRVLLPIRACGGSELAPVSITRSGQVSGLSGGSASLPLQQADLHSAEASCMPSLGGRVDNCHRHLWDKNLLNFTWVGFGYPGIRTRLTASPGLSQSSTPLCLLAPRHPPHALNSLATLLGPPVPFPPPEHLALFKPLIAPLQVALQGLQSSFAF